MARMRGQILLFSCQLIASGAACFQLVPPTWSTGVNARSVLRTSGMVTQPSRQGRVFFSCVDSARDVRRSDSTDGLGRGLPSFHQGCSASASRISDCQNSISRRALLAALVGAWLSVGSSAWAQSAVVQKNDPLPEGTLAPTEQQIQGVRLAIQAYNNQELEKAEKMFSSAIDTWESLKRPRDEKAELYKFRANARVDLKMFQDALLDYNMVLSLMSDGQKPDGTARYMEYPDTFVQRGLCYEGLYMWKEAVEDYDRAVKLWGGGRGKGVNPYVLTFRANALGQLGRYQDSLTDYKAAETLFLERRDADRALDSRANYALALYETGETEEAVKIMQEIVRRKQGYTDMHVALAAVEWAAGRREEAENEWETACDRISSGCKKYKDVEWVKVVRRWPPSLTEKLSSFLQMKESEPMKLSLPVIPDLAPSSN